MGCECGGEGGIGLALVSYLHETVVAGARAARTTGAVGAATGGGRGCICGRRRGGGPHARSIGETVPTAGLRHSGLGEGWRRWKWGVLVKEMVF